MSETLSDAAPLEGTAVDPVGSEAPVVSEEVVEGSAPQSEAPVVPAARFNGLMGKFNQTQNELTQVRAELESLRASQTESSQPVTAETGDIEVLKSQVSTLTTLLMEERVDSARRKALDEFPGAKPLADLITSDDPTQIREVARLIHERLGGIGTEGAGKEPVVEGAAGEAPASAEGTAPVAAPAAPVVGGGVAFSGDSAMTERVVDAVKNRDFGAYIRAKRELAEASQLEG